MLNKMIAEREIEISNIIPPPPIKKDEIEKKEINNEDNNKINDIKEITGEKANINIMISGEINTNNEEIKPVKKLTNDFFKNLSKTNVSESNIKERNKVVSFNEDFNEDDEYEKDRCNSQIVYSNNNIMGLLEKLLNNDETILRNQDKILRNQDKIIKKFFFT